MDELPAIPCWSNESCCEELSENLSPALPIMFVNQLSENELGKAVSGGELGTAGSFDAERIGIKNNLDQ